MTRSIALMAMLIAFSTAVRAQALITVKPVSTPFEAGVASAATLTFHVHAHNEAGEPVTLGSALEASVAIATWQNQEAGLSILQADDTWTLPQGFSAGQRTNAVAVTGTPPEEPVTAELTLQVTVGEGEPEGIDFAVSIAPGVGAAYTSIDFCVAPAQGGGQTPIFYSTAKVLDLYADFGEVQAVGVIGAMNADAETVANDMQLRIVEIVDGEEVSTSALQTANAAFTAMDLDDNGLAEFVQTTFNLQAPQPIVVATDSERVFALYARRTDLDPVVDILLAEITIEPRESTFAMTLWLEEDEHHVTFHRDDSPPLRNPFPRLYLNDVLLPEASQVTATVEPSGANGYANTDSGLYDLSWTVVIDWEKLKTVTAIDAGDTFRVDLTFPGTSVPAISATMTVESAEAEDS